jgi:hypothetical protein
MGISGLRAIERGVSFLIAEQCPSGQIPTYTGDLAGTDQTLEPSPFGTALAVLALRTVPGSDTARLRRRAVGFLRSEMASHALWRHWLVEDPRHPWIPFDMDDTACVSSALEQEGIPFPPNHDLLLANRATTGRFYTWFTPRLRPFPRDATYWRVTLPRWRHPARSGLFWLRFDAGRRDIDCVVNANVLAYLGDRPGTEHAAAYLADVLRRGVGAFHDRWYQSELVYCYALARCVSKGFDSLRGASRMIIQRVLAFANADGSIGSNALETALAISALSTCGAPADSFSGPSSYLLGAQDPSGSWPIAPLYYSGPRRLAAFGSAQLTTAFCLEALSRNLDA